MIEFWYFKQIQIIEIKNVQEFSRGKYIGIGIHKLLENAEYLTKWYELNKMVGMYSTQIDYINGYYIIGLVSILLSANNQQLPQMTANTTVFSSYCLVINTIAVICLNFDFSSPDLLLSKIKFSTLQSGSTEQDSFVVVLSFPILPAA